jgi:hypothetical protein
MRATEAGARFSSAFFTSAGCDTASPESGDSLSRGPSTGCRNAVVPYLQARDPADHPAAAHWVLTERLQRGRRLASKSSRLGRLLAPSSGLARDASLLDTPCLSSHLHAARVPEYGRPHLVGHRVASQHPDPGGGGAHRALDRAPVQQGQQPRPRRQRTPLAGAENLLLHGACPGGAVPSGLRT